MRITNISVLLLTSLFSSGCMAPKSYIPAGRYALPSSGNWITITNNQMAFYLGPGARVAPGKVYRYVRQPSGGVSIILDRSVEILNDIGRSDFYWDGESVIMVDRAGKTNRFICVPE